jgi:hypothetical protein
LPALWSISVTSSLYLSDIGWRIMWSNTGTVV